jgi:hypothetical protein
MGIVRRQAFIDSHSSSKKTLRPRGYPDGAQFHFLWVGEAGGGLIQCASKGVFVSKPVG